MSFISFLKQKSTIVFFLLFILVRLPFLTFLYTLSSDQGIAYLQTYRLFQNRELTLIGPISSFAVEGRSFFYGPITYYLALPFLLLSNWNTVILNYLMLVLQLVSVGFLVFNLQKLAQGKIVAPFLLLLFAITPAFITGVNYWNPHLTIPAAIVATAFLIQIVYLGKRSFWQYFLLGMVSGLGMQAHYGFVFLLVVIFVELLVRKKLYLLPLILGFCLGFAPIIVFELRNNFYNIQTLLAYILKRSGNYPFHWYHLYALFPYLFLKYVQVLSKKVPLLMLTGGIYVVVSCIFLTQLFSNFYEVEQILPFHRLKAMQAIIEKEGETQANIIDIKTGDVRATALRYLLTAHQFPLLTENEYPQTQVLYMYASVPIEPVLAGSLWEMDQVKPFEVTGSWVIDRITTLYELTKVAGS